MFALLARSRAKLLIAAIIFLLPLSLSSFGQAPEQNPPNSPTQGAPATPSAAPEQNPPNSPTQIAPATPSAAPEQNPPNSPTQVAPATPPPAASPTTPPVGGPDLPGSPAPPAGNGAQDQPDQEAGVFVFKKEVEEVVLHATVVDEQRHLISNLDRNTFSVFEDGTAQTITSFHRDRVPIAMGIVIDNSGSMLEKRPKVNEAVLNLLRQNQPGDEVFVVNFSDDCYLDQDFTSDVNLLQSALEKVSMRGRTALYDAIVASSVHLQNNPRIETKVLLVITDGRDNASQQTLQAARLRLQQKNGPTLYAIGLMGDDLSRQDRSVLEDLADSTGGAAFFPRGLDELDDISRTIGQDIHDRYTIGYKSTSLKPSGQYRAIQVEAQSRGYRGLTVRTRTGYYPGEAVH